MRGNAQFYQRKALENQKELRKLEKAKRKYEKILEDIDRSITHTQLILRRDMHCVSIQSADSEDSVIID